MSSLFFSFFFLISISTTSSKTHPNDIQALLLIKSSIDPTSISPGSCLSSWDFSSSDPCDSSFSTHFTCGIRCDARTDDGLSRATDISLDSAGYRGPLSPSVWSLPLLQTLDLSNNLFSGNLPPPPPAIPSSRLQRLALSRNSFTGEIPDLSALVSLQEVSVDGNLFTGVVKVSNLGQLQRLDLQSNNLTGEIPDLRSLPLLSYLDASQNLLTGPFDPSRLPTSIIEVSLRNNHLYGDLEGGPPFSLLRNLQVLDLSHNGLSGTIPSCLFVHPSLEQLTLSYNRFQVIQPPYDGGLSSRLVAIDLGHNGLTGLLPGFIGSMQRLTAVDLEDNKFTGMIPVQYAMRVIGTDGMVQFGRMVLKGNYLFGPIPGAMGAMKEGDSGEVSLNDNCLFRCPPVFFFCEDGVQKPLQVCREFNPVIP